MDIVLVAGLWLDASVWGDVAARLQARGHHAVPVTLPGQGDGRTSATLADQVAAVVAAVDAAEKPMVVGHSAACSLAWLAADARPAEISKVALLGGFPSGDGEVYFDSSFPARDGAVPSRAGPSSKAQIPPTWTTLRSWPSRRRPSRSPKGSPAE